jgi:hypothetical protein
MVRAAKQVEAGRAMSVALAEGADARPHPENASAKIPMGKARDQTEITIRTEFLNLTFSISYR